MTQPVLSLGSQIEKVHRENYSNFSAYFLLSRLLALQILLSVGQISKWVEKWGGGSEPKLICKFDWILHIWGAMEGGGSAAVLLEC